MLPRGGAELRPQPRPEIPLPGADLTGPGPIWSRVGPGQGSLRSPSGKGGCGVRKLPQKRGWSRGNAGCLRDGGV